MSIKAVIRVPALVAVILAGAPAPVSAADALLFERAAAWGSVRVIDGDTLVIGEARVRLVGIDAPEEGEPGGLLAEGALGLLVGMEEVLWCVASGRDRWGRHIGRCFALPGGRDLSTAMVEEGYARSDARFSSAGRPEAEARARAARAGLWACTAEAPASWPKDCD